MVGDGHDLLLWPLACVVSTAHTHTKHEMAQRQVFVVWQGCWWWLAIVLVCGVQLVPMHCVAPHVVVACPLFAVPCLLCVQCLLPLCGVCVV